MKNDFNFEESLVEETVPSDCNVWNPCTGNENSEKDAVSQANDFDKFQMSNGHRKQPKQNTWKIESIWNLIHGLEERAQLDLNGLKDYTIWQHDFRDNSSVTRTQICSSNVPTTASWRNGSCNVPAKPFKTRWIHYGPFDKLENS